MPERIRQTFLAVIAVLALALYLGLNWWAVLFIAGWVSVETPPMNTSLYFATGSAGSVACVIASLIGVKGAGEGGGENASRWRVMSSRMGGLFTSSESLRVFLGVIYFIAYVLTGVVCAIVLLTVAPPAAAVAAGQPPAAGSTVPDPGQKPPSPPEDPNARAKKLDVDAHVRNQGAAFIGLLIATIPLVFAGRDPKNHKSIDRSGAGSRGTPAGPPV